MSDNQGRSIPVELLKKYDRPGPRYTSYPTAPVWSDEVNAEHYRRALKAASERVDEPLAIYCHIPFCRKRCYYCGCNTVITNNESRIRKYLRALLVEVDATAALLGKRKSANQLHLGGGTPTFVEIEGLTTLVNHLKEKFEFTSESEMSIEIDPRVTSLTQLDSLAALGFNRISIGVQDFDPEVQKASGREQSYATIKQLIEHGRKLGFKGINIDLIYGLPRQTVESFRSTLDASITLRPDRVAVYSFAYLPSVKPHQSMIKIEELPATEEKYLLFASAVEKFIEVGYRQIGMDHFALPEDELALAQEQHRLHRNFMGYTVQTAPEMIGFGMSSIGYIDNNFFQNHSGIDSYEKMIAADGFAIYRGLKLSEDDLIRQFTITSLMCNFRIDFGEFNRRFGVTFTDYFGNELQNLRGFADDSLLQTTDSGIFVAPLGRTFVRNIAMTFDAHLAAGEIGNGKMPTFSRTI